MNKHFIIKIITIISTLVLLVVLLTISFHKKTEIVKVGEIPKAFPVQTLKLPIDKPNKEKRKMIKSVVSDKTIYLTFDDGPSNLTNQILDILKEEKVPATFFVIGRHITEYQNTVKRAYNDGHTIALHSYTHNYKYVYSADQNYFDDLKQIDDSVYNITGHHAKIVRLPGGSSNTVSRKYNPGITTRITQKLIEDGYNYFDWNVDSGDASGKLNKDQIYHNTTMNLHHITNVVLMHDTAVKTSTVEALRDIIIYGKNNGYTFAKITKNTPDIKHHINN